MSIGTQQSGPTGTYKFGTGDEHIAQLSVDKSYTTQIDIVDGNGVLKDIVYGGEEVKISATKFATDGASAPELGTPFSAGGASGTVTKSTTLSSNEDVTKIQIEALGAPGISQS